MPAFDPEPFENWSEDEQALWDGMVANSGHPELNADRDLQAFYDVAFNTPKGDITGQDRANIIDAIVDYMDEQYEFDFREMFDWNTWREEIYETH